MSYKTIMTVFRDPVTDTAHLEAAIEIADREGAHLRVFAVGIERLPPETYFGGSTSILVQGTMAEAQQEADTAEDGATPILKRSNPVWDLQRVVAPVGAVAQILGRFAALTDLVVLPQCYGDGRNVEDVAVLEAALFSSRTPVLVLPAGVSTAPAAKKVVVAWNQSTEALAAIRASMPLLKAADVVDVCVIDQPHPTGLADPGSQLAELLSRHGVNVEVSVVAKTLPAVSEVIERHVEDIGADMVVMGAYGHSRFRESILGGTTRNMLEKASVPVFMAH